MIIQWAAGREDWLDIASSTEQRRRLLLLSRIKSQVGELVRRRLSMVASLSLVLFSFLCIFAAWTHHPGYLILLRPGAVPQPVVRPGSSIWYSSAPVVAVCYFLCSLHQVMFIPLKRPCKMSTIRRGIRGKGTCLDVIAA